MNQNTLFVGKVVISFAQLGSTNSFATEYLSKNKPSEGTVISTRHQFEGRGQVGSSWESEAGKNIAMSVILYPKFLSIAQQFYLSKSVALAVRDFLVNELPSSANVWVKWPNDVYINDKKIAGILIQNSIAKHQIKHSVVGIGININQIAFQSDAPNPTSLQLETQQNFNLEALNQNLYWHVEKRYLQLKASRWSSIDKDYHKYLYKKGILSSFKDVENNLIFKGTIAGTSANGQLLIATDDGLKRFDMKTVRFLK